MTKPVAKKKRKTIPKVPPTGGYRSVEWVAIGGDISMSSIALAGTAVLKNGKRRKARAVIERWERGTDYFERMEAASRAERAVHELFSALKVMPELNQVYIALEEPWAFGMVRGGQSNALKQQAQISGAFIGGLLRWGWKQVFEIQANYWRKLVADDLGITIHHTKWNPTKTEGKFRAKEWVEKFHPNWDGHWPDLISHTKKGLIPRPEGSRAKAVQSDDRYEAFAMMQWMCNEIKTGG